MKRICALSLCLTLILCAISCQENGLDNGQYFDQSLKITATIVPPAASRVTYAVDNETTFTIQPTWTENDKIFGFDSEGNQFTFTVTSVSEGRATLTSGAPGYNPNNDVTLYAIYAPGYDVDDLDDTNANNQTLTVDLTAQDGALDATAPFLMCATATVSGGSVNLSFEYQAAIVGIKKFKIKPVSAVTTVNQLVLNGAVAAGTFQIVNTKLQLVPSGSPAPITAAGPWSTDANGVYNTPVYFAVLPTTSANLELHAVAGSDTYVNLASITETNLAAGSYYHMAKILDAVADVDGVKYDSIDAAWAAANAATSDVTVTLLANCTAGATLTLNNTGSGAVTLDLNGKVLTGPTSSYTLHIRQNRSLTICDNSTDDVADQGSIIGVSEAHTIYVPTATVEIQGGNIVAPTGYDKCALWIQSSSSATISGGKLISSKYRGSYVGSNSTLTITGGEIESDAQCVFSVGTTTISDGVFNVITPPAVTCSLSTAVGTISGGSFSGSEEGELFTVLESGNLYVTGGLHDRAINSSRTVTSTGYARMHTLNTAEATKNKYPFKIGNYTGGYPFVDAIGSKTYWHNNSQSAARQAQMASDDITVRLRATPSSTQSAMNLTNAAGHTVTLDLRGYTLSTAAESFITTAGTLVIQDTGASKGKITSTKSKVIDITAKDANVALDGVVIESTKATGDSWNGDAVINMASSGGTLEILDSEIYSTEKLSTLRAYNGTTTITDSELSSGVESAGWYVVLGLNLATVTINSGSFYTSGTGTASTCHIAYSNASITVENGYFYSEGRTVSSGSKSYYGRMTLNGGYYNQMPSVPSADSGQDSPNYGSGLTMQSITPVSFPHSTITGKECGYQVKAEAGEAEAQASTTEPVASYGTARTGGVYF